MLRRLAVRGNDVPSPLGARSSFLSILFKAVFQGYCYVGLFHFFCIISDLWQSWPRSWVWLWEHLIGMGQDLDISQSWEG